MKKKVITKVMNNLVLLDPIEQTTTTKGGLILSEQDRKEIGVEKAKVVDVGPLCTDAIRIGDVAIYNAGMVDSVEIDGDIFRCIPEQFISLIQREE